MAETSVLPQSLLGVESFREDLKGVLLLPVEALQVMARIAEASDAGYDPASGAEAFGKEAELPLEVARHHLRLVDYVYDLCIEHKADAAAIVDDLVAVSRELEVPLDEEHKAALGSVFDYKSAYEKGMYARAKVTSGQPHFIEVEGGWNVRAHQTRTGELVRVPFVGLTVSLHEAGGEPKSVFFVMDNEKWDSFVESIAAIEKERTELQGWLRSEQEDAP